jgi:pyruvate dehydrogenase (quinone)/pyruvate oxidase
LNLQPSFTVAELILSQLKLWGIKRIYGVIGDALFGLMDAIGKDQELRFISVKHEATAALMASAEARLTGKPGVCVSQMGPGMGNLLNGLGDAHLDRLPAVSYTHLTLPTTPYV